MSASDQETPAVKATEAPEAPEAEEADAVREEAPAEGRGAAARPQAQGPPGRGGESEPAGDGEWAPEGAQVARVEEP
ncbi:hypothetical protein ACFV0D_36505, partial [Streptomyces sp. NPDC059556]